MRPAIVAAALSLATPACASAIRALPPRTLASPPAGFRLVAPAVAHDPVYEHYLVVWQAQGTGGFRVSTRLLLEDGQPTAATSDVSEGIPGAEPARPAVTALAGGAGFLVAWLEHGEARFRALDQEGRGGPLTRTLGPAVDVAVAAGPDGGALAVVTSPGTPRTVSAVPITPAGTARSPRTLGAASDGERARPAVIARGTGFTVAWAAPGATRTATVTAGGTVRAGATLRPAPQGPPALSRTLLVRPGSAARAVRLDDRARPRGPAHAVSLPGAGRLVAAAGGGRVLAGTTGARPVVRELRADGRSTGSHLALAGSVASGLALTGGEHGWFAVFSSGDAIRGRFVRP